MEEFIKRRRRDIAFDKDNRYVFLAETQWTGKTVIDNHPEIEFFEKSDF
jgi:peptide chain release factor 3